MGSLVNPLKSSVRSMGNMVKNAPENLLDGLRDGIIKVLRSRPFASSMDAMIEESGKVGAGIDIEVSNVIQELWCQVWVMVLYSVCCKFQPVIVR